MRCAFPAFLASFLLFTGATGASAAPAERVRTVASFDASWRFLKGDAEGAEQPGFADAEWRQVEVPHDWSIEGPYAQTNATGAGGGYLPCGVSWYRKTFALPANQATRRVFVEFDGVMANSQVWINGLRLGQRPSGYVSFRYELTGHLHFGDARSNLLAVRTDTTDQPASRWYTGQGIYRHVRLVTTDPVHIAPRGVFVSASKADTNQATIRIQTLVTNSTAVTREAAVQTVILSPNGREMGTLESTHTVEAGKVSEVQHTFVMEQPQLWTLEQPALYRAVSRVRDGGRVLDDEMTTFGIRAFEFKADTGFRLNGRNVKILGVCLHHDGGALGAAVPLRVWERRLELLREVGVNAIRTAHNPVAPEFLDLCDRLGFLVMNETFDTWTARKNFAERGYNLHFREWWERDTRDVVLRDRNHPSIILWSIGNEIRDNLLAEQGRQDLLAQRDLVHQLDPTRPVTMGLFRPRESRHIPAVTDLLDVVGINYRPNDLVGMVRAGRPNIDTEETHALDRWAPVRDNAGISGIFLWTGFDYLGETGPSINGWPYVVSSNDRDIGFGLFEHDGYKLPRAWQRQSWWSPTPMVRAVRYSGHGGSGTPMNDWTPNDPDTFDVAKVEVYSNCDQVELFLNDKPLGSKPMPRSGSPAVWENLSYEPGVLKAVGRKGGQAVATHEMRSAGEPAKIVLAADRARIANEFDDVSHVTATIVDADGAVCPNQENLLSFKISGPGRILALSTGDRSSHQPFQATERKAFRGQCLAIVGAVAPSGKITLTVSADGLGEASTALDAVPAGSR